MGCSLALHRNPIRSRSPNKTKAPQGRGAFVSLECFYCGGAELSLGGVEPSPLGAVEASLGGVVVSSLGAGAPESEGGGALSAGVALLSPEGEALSPPAGVVP